MGFLSDLKKLIINFLIDAMYIFTKPNIFIKKNLKLRNEILFKKIIYYHIVYFSLVFFSFQELLSFKPFDIVTLFLILLIDLIITFIFSLYIKIIYFDDSLIKGYRKVTFIIKPFFGIFMILFYILFLYAEDYGFAILRSICFFSYFLYLSISIGLQLTNSKTKKIILKSILFTTVFYLFINSTSHYLGKLSIFYDPIFDEFIGQKKSINKFLNIDNSIIDKITETLIKNKSSELKFSTHTKSLYNDFYNIMIKKIDYYLLSSQNQPKIFETNKYIDIIFCDFLNKLKMVNKTLLKIIYFKNAYKNQMDKIDFNKNLISYLNYDMGKNKLELQIRKEIIDYLEKEVVLVKWTIVDIYALNKFHETELGN